MGYGTYTFADGRVWEGQWDGHSFLSGNKYAPGEYVARNREREIDNTEVIEEKIELEQEEDDNNFNIEEAKASCKDIGFKEGTEKFGECVLELTK